MELYRQLLKMWRNVNRREGVQQLLKKPARYQRDSRAAYDVLREFDDFGIYLWQPQKRKNGMNPSTLGMFRCMVQF
jgi:hypothetical protein